MQKTKILVLIICSLFLTACAKEGDFQPHLKNKQDALVYINPKVADKTIIPKAKQAIL